MDALKTPQHTPPTHKARQRRARANRDAAWVNRQRRATDAAIQAFISLQAHPGRSSIAHDEHAGRIEGGLLHPTSRLERYTSAESQAGRMPADATRRLEPRARKPHRWQERLRTLRNLPAPS